MSDEFGQKLQESIHKSQWHMLGSSKLWMQDKFIDTEPGLLQI